MFHISKIRLKNFKTFKETEISFPPGLVAIVGKNGSGKSNLFDAILFAMGTTSLSDLRVRNIRELLHGESKEAEVEITFSCNGEEIKIARKIDRKGGTKYFLNGKLARRYEIEEFLSRHNISPSRTVIMQGKITEMVKLPPKKKRILIDEVAGIAEFDAKIKEAEKNLEEVENKISSVSLLYGEKLDQLRVLEKEKEEAEEYLAKKQELENVRGSLLLIEKAEIERKIGKAKNEIDNLSMELEEKKKEIEKISEKIEEAIKKKEEITKKIKESLSDEKVAEYEAVKNNLYSLTTEMKNISSTLERIEREKEEKIVEKGELEDELKEVEEELNKLPEVEELPILDLGEEVENLMNELRDREKELSLVRERMIQLEREIEKIEVPEVDSDLYSSLKRKKEEIEERKRALFQEEKKLNEKLKEIEKRMSELTIKLSTSSLSHLYLGVKKLVEEMKVRFDGVYGLVIDLIEFEDFLSQAIEASAGMRLLYVVVENVAVAEKCINFLKQQGLGRLTFIPLAEIVVPKIERKKIGMGLLKDYIRSKIGNEKFIDFVFADTYLFKRFSEAKAYIRKVRIVTLDGEIIEKSALISGGKSKERIVSSAKYTEYEKELQSLKEEKKAILDRLEEIREKDFELAREKREIEAQLSEIEKKMAILKEAEQLMEERKRKEKELQNLEERKRLLEREIGVLENLIKKKREEQRKQLEEMREMEKKKVEIEKKRSALRERREMLLSRLKKVGEEIERTEEEKGQLLEKRNQLEEEKNKLEKELKRLEEELAEKKKRFKKIMEKSEQLEKTLETLGSEKEKIASSITKIEKEIDERKREVKSGDEKLRSLESELANMHFERIEASKEELERKLQELTEYFSQHQFVNLKAIDAYEIKRKEVGEIKERLDTLKKEKNAVIELIRDITKRKIQVFLEAFSRVRERFRELAEYANVEEADIILEDDKKPLESGIEIIVRRERRQIPIISLAGGEKTLLSFIFILALEYQRPSPIYLFDEIDAALDEMNVEKLAKTVRELSKKKQIFVISHRPAIPKQAEAIIGIARVGRESKVISLERSQLESLPQPLQ